MGFKRSMRRAFSRRKIKKGLRGIRRFGKTVKNTYKKGSRFVKKHQGAFNMALRAAKMIPIVGQGISMAQDAYNTNEDMKKMYKDTKSAVKSAKGLHKSGKTAHRAIKRTKSGLVKPRLSLERAANQISSQGGDGDIVSTIAEKMGDRAQGSYPQALIDAVNKGAGVKKRVRKYAPTRPKRSQEGESMANRLARVKN